MINTFCRFQFLSLINTNWKQCYQHLIFLRKNIKIRNKFYRLLCYIERYSHLRWMFIPLAALTSTLAVLSSVDFFLPSRDFDGWLPLIYDVPSAPHKRRRCRSPSSLSTIAHFLYWCWRYSTAKVNPGVDILILLCQASSMADDLIPSIKFASASDTHVLRPFMRHLRVSCDGFDKIRL